MQRIENIVTTEELKKFKSKTDEIYASKKVASTSVDGLMDKNDKLKLDNVEEYANKTIVDTTLNTTSENPVQNKVITKELNILANKINAGGGTSSFVPKPVVTASITNQNAGCVIQFQDGSDLTVDGVILSKWAGTKIVMSETAHPTSVTDGTVVLDNTTKDKYKTSGAKIENLTNGKTYYFSLFSYSTDGTYNYNQAVHLTAKPSLVKLDACTNLNVITTPGKAVVTWTDPSSIKTVDGNTATWSKSVLVYKQGTTSPTSISDGTLAINETTLNQYKTNGYTISGLVDGEDYSFSVFAISTDNALSDKTSVTAKLYSTVVVKTSESKLYGKSVKAVSGSKTATATFNLSGQATLKVAWTGETTISSTDGTNTATTKITVSSYSQTYSVDLLFLKIVTFSNGTDEEIKAMIDAHYANKINIKDYWSVGDKRTIHLSAMPATEVGESHREQDVQMAIADFDHDDLATSINGHTKAAITLTQIDCLMDASNASNPVSGSSNTENGRMNSSNTNVGGWKDCARRTWCNNIYFKALPTMWQNMVKTVNKKTSSGNQSSAIQTSQDNIWLLSEVEIYGTTTYSFTGEGIQYEYYKQTANIYKKPKWNSSCNSDIYWERSPQSGNTARFCYVNSGGGADYTIADTAIGVAPCLCI